ncbi:MAG: hypothetical protein J6X02_03830, partial [Bacilli bacterium]|nr:hypothetical protein [Bacilli bacterium]
LMSIIIHDGLNDGKENFKYDYEEEQKILEEKNKLYEYKTKLMEDEIANEQEIFNINLKIKDLNKKLHFTAFNHPILIRNLVLENKDKLELTEEELKLVCSCVESHMGGIPWNIQYKYNSDEIMYELPVPKTKYQVLVHTVDYLSSRRYLSVKFTNNEIEDD